MLSSSTLSILTLPSPIGERRPILPSFLKRGWRRLSSLFFKEGLGEMIPPLF